MRSAADWPGVHCVAELCAGHDVVHGGIWLDQTAEFEARRRGEKVNRREFEERQDIVLAPLPCWDHLSRRERAQTIRGLVAEIDARCREEHRARGTRPLGAKAIVQQDPHRTPAQTKRSPAPWFHAATREARAALYESYRIFVAAFRAAAEALRMGARDVEFPPGSFPPGLPWVPEARPGPA